MLSRRVLLFGVTLLLATAAERADALHLRRGLRNSGAWHTEYYDPAVGAPQPLVVPPTARTQTQLHAGAPSSRVTRIRSQFQPWGVEPGIYDKRAFQPTPAWPTDTTQFGVNYVRGPR